MSCGKSLRSLNHTLRNRRRGARQVLVAVDRSIVLVSKSVSKGMPERVYTSYIGNLYLAPQDVPLYTLRGLSGTSDSPMRIHKHRSHEEGRIEMTLIRSRYQRLLEAFPYGCLVRSGSPGRKCSRNLTLASTRGTGLFSYVVRSQKCTKQVLDNAYVNLSKSD